MTHSKSHPQDFSKATMTSAEAAAYLRVNRRTLYRYRNAGKLPYLKVGGEYRFRQADLDAFMQPEETHTHELGPLPSPTVPIRRFGVTGRRPLNRPMSPIEFKQALDDIVKESKARAITH